MRNMTARQTKLLLTIKKHCGIIPDVYYFKNEKKISMPIKNTRAYCEHSRTIKPILVEPSLFIGHELENSVYPSGRRGRRQFGATRYVTPRREWASNPRHTIHCADESKHNSIISITVIPVFIGGGVDRRTGWHARDCWGVDWWVGCGGGDWQCCILV